MNDAYVHANVHGYAWIRMDTHGCAWIRRPWVRNKGIDCTGNFEQILKEIKTFLIQVICVSFNPLCGPPRIHIRGGGGGEGNRHTYSPIYLQTMQ